MKRDLDLCRSLMLALEKMVPGEPVSGLNKESETVIVLAHLELLIEAGLLEGYSRPIPNHPNGGMFCIRKITWAGHDFIDSARNDTVWNVTRDRLKQFGSWTFSILIDMLKDEARRQISGFLS